MTDLQPVQQPDNPIESLQQATRKSTFCSFRVVNYSRAQEFRYPVSQLLLNLSVEMAADRLITELTRSFRIDLERRLSLGRFPDTIFSDAFDQSVVASALGWLDAQNRTVRNWYHEMARSISGRPAGHVGSGAASRSRLLGRGRLGRR